MSNALDVSSKEEQVVKTIKDREPINNSGISDKTGFNHTKVHRAVKSLEKKGVICNKEWKNNKTNWELEQDIEVTEKYRLKRIIDFNNILPHLAEMSLFMIALFYFSTDYFLPLAIGFTIGFLPSFIKSINYVVEENDIKELNIIKTDS